MRAIFIAAVCLLTAFPATVESPVSSFSKAKAFLADLHEEIGHLNTIYCGCPYERTTTPEATASNGNTSCRRTDTGTLGPAGRSRAKFTPNA